MKFINISNHPYDKWSDIQKEKSTQYGDCIDMKFPNVDPYNDEVYIEKIASEYLIKILDMARDEALTVHIMGEMCFTFSLVSKLIANNIKCVASTTERKVIEKENNTKEVLFSFVSFRAYK